MKKNPIEQIHSSIFDKVVKSLTLFFMILSLLISIGLDIVHGVVDFYSNDYQYEAQNATIAYISDNLVYKPIKQDLDCDSSEETQQLFPFAEYNITRWYSQLICVTRYVDIRLSTECSATEYNCGPYCIETSEGSQCPISKLTIIQNEVVDEDADQNLESKRDLYIQRENSSYGIFKIQVVIRGYPCLNPLIYITAGLTNNSDYIDPENCEGSDFDTDNSVKIEQTTLSEFAKQGLEALSFNGVPSSVTNSAVTYLTARNKIASTSDNKCIQIDNNMINDTENCEQSIQEIGFIYVVIKEIFSGFIGIVLIIEIYMLKFRIVNDIRIITVILKILLICQMSFILIEGGLILYQEKLRSDSELYFKSIADCYSSDQIQNVFANFPNLFPADVNTYISLITISIIIIAISEFILIMMFIVQMFHWCFKQKKEKAYFPESDTQRQPIPSKEDIHHSETSPYQNPLSPHQSKFPPVYSSVKNNIIQNQSNPANYVNEYVPPNQFGDPAYVPPNQFGESAQPKFSESYIPPQINNLQSTTVVAGKKNSKY
ncbi:unnamed protein product (macronuclear) [Paramecium tetraurelia]|uniref:Transmembrane protein n=1 Tax=Paramecium tetraurelia TaxID=5888 RepID=A0BTG8_PARTE|nr:uncharacterized protein GSPATT00032067001 [Paramecium tetraurelia]CAK61835.1 unnamed protein product [Paramecium tetraurelia]|eukprot:XP_001429233.1 hypothetical protein (macronuclear) [Paramecium tetraurelia strain d4-2]